MRKRSLQQTPQLCLFGDADFANGEDLSTQAYTAVAVAAAEVVQTSFAQITPLPEPINVMLSDVAGGDDGALTQSTEMIATPDLLSDEANAGEIRQQQAWPDFDATQYAPANGKSQRISDNLAAIKLAKEILAIPTRIPTSEERHTMLKYSGWGGFAKVFEEYEGNKSAAEQQQLRAVMTEQEFASARASVTTAYYTPASLVSYVWGIVRKLGFTGGRILEPAAGNGLFLAGMPQDIAQNSSTMAVELDSVGAQLLQAAFRGTAVQALHSPIEKAPIKDKSFDLVIGNVPFGNFKSLEIRSVPYSEWLIHNYFFGKAVDAVRPGGLIVMLTSTGTLDSASNTHRQWIDAHAELLSAVRLPQGMFKAHSGTEVSVDLLVLRRRETVKFSEQGTGWKKTEKPSDAILDARWRIKSGGNRFSSVSYDVTPEINQWFNSKPGLLIGELQTQKNQYGQDALVLVEQGDTGFDSVTRSTEYRKRSTSLL
jgi:phospholipid N-methyltransferase